MRSVVLSLFLALPLAGESTPTPETPALAPEIAEGPLRDALGDFQAGRHASAIEAARPLAENGDPNALFLMGFASETGRGVDPSRESALEFYRKASEAGHKEATYRRALILLNSSANEDRQLGRKALEEASKDDPATAGRILGEAWLRGLLGDEPDFDKGAEWWGRASESGDTTSIILLARLFNGDFGFAEKVDIARSIGLLRKAAALEVKGAYIPLGSRLLNGEEKFRNEREGREWLDRAIEDGQSAAYLALGDFEENIAKDLKAAWSAYYKGAGAGQTDCMLRLAKAYYQGRGVEKSDAKGREWLEKAAEAGHPTACLELASLLSKAEEPDRLAIYRNLLAAAEGGLPVAQNELALHYLSGSLGASDAPAAAAWFTRAAKAGLAAAQNNLATLYERGLGVPVSFDNAGELYGLAADQGHASATTALARMHAVGLGTEPDLVKAWALASLAVERGDDNGKAILGELSTKLTPELLTEAKKALDELKSPAPEKASPEEP